MSPLVLHSRRRLTPPAAVALGFLALIAAGTLLLSLPFCSWHGHLGLVDALFTATSAACVTGLTVVDTGSHFSPAGKLVLLLLFQIGGLGILTVSSVFALLARRDLGMGHRFTLSEDLRTGGIHGLRRLLLGVVSFTLLIEGLGALLLHLSAGPGLGAGRHRAFAAVFHSVSAFCNAGFSLYPDSLARFLERPLALLSVALLVMLGGLGFLLSFEILGRLRRRPRRRHFSVQGRIVLVGSLVLWLGGTLLFVWTERNGALAQQSPGRQLLMAFFQSVTCRTAGFDVFAQGLLSPAGTLGSLLLMFIGAAPGSTGGGVKVSTVILVLLLLRGYFAGRIRVDVAGRSIPDTVLREALAVMSAGLVMVVLGTLLILLTAHVALDRAAFEVVSAFGTVGLGVGLSAELGPAGKLLLVVIMFCGRVGLLTVALGLAGGWRERHFQLPPEAPMVG